MCTHAHTHTHTHTHIHTQSYSWLCRQVLSSFLLCRQKFKKHMACVAKLILFKEWIAQNMFVNFKLSASIVRNHTSYHDALQYICVELYLDRAVPVLDQTPAPLQFYRDYVAPNKPVVLSDLTATWPALHKWDLQYLRYAPVLWSWVYQCSDPNT